MNEAFKVILNLNTCGKKENEILTEKIDHLLMNFGIRNIGPGNYYVPLNPRNRDHAVFLAGKVLKEAIWLQNILIQLQVCHRTDVCSLPHIKTDRMASPAEEKWKYYENYYKATKHLAHALVVDENRQLRDGYISYLLAVKYHLRPEVYEALSDQPLAKLVIGRHVGASGGRYIIRNKQAYCWRYTLERAVVPGDILEVYTGKGRAYMCVEKIEYAAGTDFCREHFKVRRHMGIRMELQKTVNG